MHFIGNRAITLGNGDPSIQLVYNSGYTTLSVFLPIIGLTFAFSVAEFPSTSKAMHWCLLSCTGVFAGLSIVGMHYIGNFGISNYTLAYTHRFLAASIIIAIGDCAIVLILFYTWREKWISSWWKRLLCAALLAGGVSAMHFTASTKCVYVLRGYNGAGAIASRNTQVTVAGVLCAAAAAIILCVMFIARHRASLLKTRSQKVMLACVMFDPDGRLLVTTEGVLPSREITDRYQHRTFSEDFDTAHPVFQWIFRVTRNWNGVSDLIPRMKSHLNALSRDVTAGDSKPVSSRSSAANYDPDTYSDYTIVFRERFCTAAASLAAAMNIPIERIGVLYDKIVETGTLNADDRLSKREILSAERKLQDIESAMSRHHFGKGQLLFLARQLSVDDTDKLLNAGFKFGNVQQVGRNIAESMQVPGPALEMHMADLRRYVENLSSVEKSGTWLSLYALIPRPNSKGFDVAVKKEAQEQLPDTQLLPIEPQQWQADFLQRLDGHKARPCIAFLEDRAQTDRQRSPQERQFAAVVLQGIRQLSMQVPADWFAEARFLSRPVTAHYSPQSRLRTGSAVVYSFCVITDMHTSTDACNAITRVPLNFFSARQRCYKGSPDHGILARDIHQEFGPLLARRLPTQPGRSRVRHKMSAYTKRARAPRRPQQQHGRALDPRPSTSRSSSSPVHSASTSVHELVDRPGKRDAAAAAVDRADSADADAGAERDNVWGGILVNSETVVKSDSKSDYSNDSRQLGLGMRVAVGTARQENTFADELFEITRARFMQPKLGY